MFFIREFFSTIYTCNIYVFTCFYLGPGATNKSWNKWLCLRSDLKQFWNKRLRLRLNARGLTGYWSTYIDQVTKSCKDRRGICVERACPNASCLRSLASLPINCDYVNFLYLSISLQILAHFVTRIYIQNIYISININIYYACNV